MALALRPSFARALLDSSTHQQHLKSEEARLKADAAVVGRLDLMLRSFGQLGKVIVSAVSARR